MEDISIEQEEPSRGKKILAKRRMYLIMSQERY